MGRVLATFGKFKIPFFQEPRDKQIIASAQAITILATKGIKIELFIEKLVQCCKDLGVHYAYVSKCGSTVHVDLGWWKDAKDVEA